MSALKPRTVGAISVVGAGLVALAVVIAVPVGGSLPLGAPPMPQAGENPVLAPFPNNGDGGPKPRGVAKALAGPLASSSLGSTRLVAVYDAGSGNLIYQQGFKTPAIPASTDKVLTAATVLTAYGADFRISTSVVKGANPNELILKGGGDPNLKSGPAPAPLNGSSPASLAGLAAETSAALKKKQANPAPVTVRYDDSLFSGPTTAPSWPSSYVNEGLVSEITALMADGGGGSNPSATAASKFAKLLGEQGIRVRAVAGSAALSNGEQIAVVRSAPLSAAVQQMLQESDNTSAEVLAHLAGARVVNDGSFSGGAQAVTQTLKSLQVTTQGLLLVDGSGLSRSNRVPPIVLGELINKVSQNVNPQVWGVTYGMPVAGFSGTLSDRFVSSASKAGRGEVRAKTGTLTSVSSLAGTVTTVDGDLLTFVFMAPSADNTFFAEAAWDDAAAALALCGCQ